MSFLTKANHLLLRRPSTFAYQLLKQLAKDYRDALIEAGRKAIERPIRTIFYSSNVYLLVYAYRTMPSFQSYQNGLIEFRQQQIMTSSLIRSKHVETYVDAIEQLLAAEQIHFVDCFLFSLIIYRSQHQTDGRYNRMYENLCSYLHLKRHARIIDIGAFNRWFILKKKLRQADIFDDVNIEKPAS